QARSHLSRHTPADAQQASEQFERVINVDPSFAPAYAGAAMALEQIRFWNQKLGIDDSGTGIEMRMRSAIEKALTLDPLLAEAHAALGTVLAREAKWAPAEHAFRRSIELNPTLTATYTRFAQSTLLPQGKVAEALTQARRALQIDPLSLDALRA